MPDDSLIWEAGPYRVHYKDDAVSRSLRVRGVVSGAAELHQAEVRVSRHEKTPKKDSTR